MVWTLEEPPCDSTASPTLVYCLTQLIQNGEVGMQAGFSFFRGHACSSISVSIRFTPAGAQSQLQAASFRPPRLAHNFTPISPGSPPIPPSAMATKRPALRGSVVNVPDAACNAQNPTAETVGYN